MRRCRIGPSLILLNVGHCLRGSLTALHFEYTAFPPSDPDFFRVAYAIVCIVALPRRPHHRLSALRVQ